MERKRRISLWQMFHLLFIATAYTYHWIPCLTSAVIKMIINEPTWSKTPRFNKKRFTPKNQYVTPKEPPTAEMRLLEK